MYFVGTPKGLGFVRFVEGSVSGSGSILGLAAPLCPHRDPDRAGRATTNPRLGQGWYRQTTTIYWGNIGIMENKMETTIIYWGNIGIMENKMETTIIWVIVPLNSSSGYTGLRAYRASEGLGVHIGLKLGALVLGK